MDQIAEVSGLGQYVDKFQCYLEATARKYGIPGVSASLFVDRYSIDLCAGSACVGGKKLTGRHAFLLGRSLKLLLTVAMMKYVDLGYIGLEDRLSKYLPELSSTLVGEGVQLSHLLSETSGFVSPDFANSDVRERLSWNDLVVAMRSSEALFDPGEVFSFSHVNQILLARLLSIVASSDVYAAIEKVLAEESLGKLHSVSEATEPEWRVSSHSPTSPGGKPEVLPMRVLGQVMRESGAGLWLKTTDMVKIVRLASRRPSSTGNRLAPLWREVVSCPYAIPSPCAEEPPRGAGFGLLAFKDNWWGLEGPGLGQSLMVRVHAKYDVAMVIGFNKYAPRAMNELRMEIATSLGIPATDRVEELVSGAGLRASDVIGQYKGMTGGMVTVSQGAQGSLECIFQTAGSDNKLLLTFRRNMLDVWQLVDPTCPFNAGFFWRMDMKEPIFMLGNVTYRRSRESLHR